MVKHLEFNLKSLRWHLFYLPPHGSTELNDQEKLLGGGYGVVCLLCILWLLIVGLFCPVLLWC